MAKLPNDSGAIQRFERFLGGEPLNEELAAVRAGAATELQHPLAPVASERRPTEVADRELTRAERLELRELRTGEGWPLLMHLLRKRLDELRKAAIVRSQQNPLAQAEAIAREWAYVTVYEQVLASIERTLEVELLLLEPSEKSNLERE